jgi:hypothetical protein
LNGLGGYVPPTRLPPREYVIRTLDQIAVQLARVPYRRRCRFTSIAAGCSNRRASSCWIADLEAGRRLVARPLDVLRSCSTRACRSGPDRRPGRDEKEITFSFKATNSFRQHEPFFLSLPDRLATVLPPETTATSPHLAEVDLHTADGLASLQVTDFYAGWKQGDIGCASRKGNSRGYIRRRRSCTGRTCSGS